MNLIMFLSSSSSSSTNFIATQVLQKLQTSFSLSKITQKNSEELLALLTETNCMTTVIWTTEKPCCRVGQFWPKVKNDIPISYCFEVTPNYCLNFKNFAFLSLLWGLGSTYTIHLRFIGKRVADFLLALLALFSKRLLSRSSRTVSLWQLSFLHQWAN